MSILLFILLKALAIALLLTGLKLLISIDVSTVTLSKDANLTFSSSEKSFVDKPLPATLSTLFSRSVLSAKFLRSDLLALSLRALVITLFWTGFVDVNESSESTVIFTISPSPS